MRLTTFQQAMLSLGQAAVKRGRHSAHNKNAVPPTLYCDMHYFGARCS
jgi:hypothetical protein